MPKSTISFYAADVSIPVSKRILLKDFIGQQIRLQRGKDCFYQIRIIFCSDEYLLGINRQFLNHDYYTDIITFPLINTPKALEAEIYISTERVKENSKLAENQNFILSNRRVSFTLSSPFAAELHRVIFHGILHLLGYKDKTTKQQTAIRQAEDLWLIKYGDLLEEYVLE